MFKFLRRRSSQISSQPILDRGIDAMVAQRNAHLAEMNRLETVIAEATRAYDQHTRLYDALNNSLFTINHPFDPVSEELAEALANTDFDADLSVDQPSDEERAADKRIIPSSGDVFADLGVARPADLPPPVVPLRGSKRRKATSAEAAE